MKNKIKFSVLTIGIVFAALVFAHSKQHAQIKPAEPQTKAAETAGQHFKNVKVLTEMPAEQMGKVMNIMAASLGVNCNFCHVEGDFSKDDKEEKQTAREMIKMTFALNKDYFNNRPEISCNTCHNGHGHPQSAPNLNVVADGHGGHGERPKQPETKPTIEQILAKYSEAVGAQSKTNSRYIKAQRVEPKGDAEAEEIWQKGSKLAITTTYPKAVVTEVFDGATAWKRAGANQINLKPDEAEQIRRNAEILGGVELKTIYPKMEFAFVDQLDGREVYQVRAQTASGARERLYFDTQSGLLVRRVAAVPTVLGNYVYQIDYTDYKDFGGVKLPATMRYATPGVSWTRKIIEVKNNAPVEDAKFNQSTK